MESRSTGSKPSAWARFLLSHPTQPNKAEPGIEGWTSSHNDRLPFCSPVVFQKFSPGVFAGVEAGNDRVQNPRGAVHDIERRMEAVFGAFARCDRFRIFVGHPAGVD